ncbi:secreted protein [Rhodopirellula sp. SWK7]|uniref:secreted protein n=1 Tax=Rhodopirellula sp. SWK7 TaxID=595460 RepID=UPI0002BDF4EF|nr:secreted protein [Rhodopirellula sp. SWK7]EMI45589.1 secreted protein [Rhodopirellula sp. SWK7]
MKKLFILLGLALVVGCGESQPTNVADGASLSEIEQYRQMVEESEKAAAAGYEEAEAAYSADPKS